MFTLFSPLQESPVVSIPSDAPEWVSQWAALTNQKARTTTDGVELMSPYSPASFCDKGENKMLKELSPL